MREELALLRSVVESSDEDTPRLVYADWLEENNSPERAEFIRVQVELVSKFPPFGDGRHHPDCRAERPSVLCGACEWLIQTGELRKRERDLQTLDNCMKWFGGIPGTAISWTKSNGFHGWYIGDTTIRATPRRGFIDSLTLSWSDWLTHSPALVWTPGQTVECPKCVGDRVDASHEPCTRCSASGFAQRPFPPTAQPVRRVRITSPYTSTQRGDEGGPNWSVDWFVMPDAAYSTEGYRFDRVKCPTCAGRGTQSIRAAGGHGYRGPCLDCKGEPLNEWTCPAWPMQRFEMPEAEPARMEDLPNVARDLGNRMAMDLNRRFMEGLLAQGERG